MPIYLYYCQNCGKEFEYLILPGREQDLKCPQCNGRDLNKLPVGFRLRTSDASGESGSSCSTCSGGDCSSCR